MKIKHHFKVFVFDVQFYKEMFLYNYDTHGNKTMNLKLWWENYLTTSSLVDWSPVQLARGLGFDFQVGQNITYWAFFDWALEKEES